MKLLSVLIFIFPVLAFTSCASDPDVRRGQATGAVVGGAAVGLMSDSWGGAAIGAVAGGLIGGEIAKNR